MIKPHYVFRPRQGLRRLAQVGRREPGEITVRLPWGMPIAIDTTEAIGKAIWRHGLYDLPLSETLWRLLDPGDLAIDVGANLGYTTALMAFRCGAAGRVLAFEPHDRVFARLEANIERWRADPRVAPIEARAQAVSDAPGSRAMVEGRGFARNQGTAHVAATALIEAEPGSARIVAATTLDETLEGRRAALVKIDVEGHEREVLAGARESLRAGRIRHLVYEAYANQREALADHLRAFGYTVWALGSEFSGPLLATDFGSVRLPPYEAPNFLATLDASQTAQRLRRRGWEALRGPLSPGRTTAPPGSRDPGARRRE